MPSPLPSDKELARDIMEVIPRAMRTLRSELRAQARSELTVPQFRVLNRLARGDATNGEIAEWMGVTAPTATRMIDALVRRGLVLRARTSRADARTVRIRLTAKGRARVQAMRLQIQSILAHALESLPTPSKRRLAGGLTALREVFAERSEA